MKQTRRSPLTLHEQLRITDLIRTDIDRAEVALRLKGKSHEQVTAMFREEVDIPDLSWPQLRRIFAQMEFTWEKGGRGMNNMFARITTRLTALEQRVSELEKENGC